MPGPREGIKVLSFARALAGPYASMEEDWRKLCKIVGREDLASDPRFQSHPDRIKNYVTFEPIMNELMITRTTADWIALLDPAGIMCGPVNDIAQVVNDPHIVEREMIVEIDHPRVGKLKVVGTPMKFSRTPCKIEKACPDVGQHSMEVFNGMLGISIKEIEDLQKNKVI